MGGFEVYSLHPHSRKKSPGGEWCTQTDIKQSRRLQLPTLSLCMTGRESSNDEGEGERRRRREEDEGEGEGEEVQVTLSRG